jgi:hypothetical protein
VFRAQAFEGIFALLPILLIAVVSIMLRARAAKKRRKRDETTAPTRSQPEEKRKPTAGGGLPKEQLPKKSIAPAPFVPQQPLRPKAAYREGYTYPPPLSLNNLKTSSEGAPLQPSPGPEIRPPDLRERMKSRLGSLAPSQQTAVKRLSVAERLERLPPLKRAVIWAEILGPPGGRQ